MTKKELWSEMLAWARKRYQELVETKSFKNGNVGIEGRLFSDALFSGIWAKIAVISKSSASMEDDVLFLRKVIEKAVDLECSEKTSPYITDKKKMALDFIKENDGVFEHQVAKALGFDIGSPIHNSTVITVLGMLEKDQRIKKDGNKWKKLL